MSTKCRFVDLNFDPLCQPDAAVRLRYALQEVNRSMAFEYAIRIEAGSLELTVHIAGKYEVSKRFSPPIFAE